MGQNLSKPELLKRIEQERPQLVQIIDETPRRLLIRRGMNDANWSIKDVIAHVADWEERLNRWCEDGLAERVPEVPGNGFGWNQTRDLNDLIYRRHRRRSLESVVSEFEQVHQVTLANLKHLSPRQLNTLSHFVWTGNSWTLSDYFLGNTASHYKWASRKCRKWLKSIG